MYLQDIGISEIRFRNNQVINEFEALIDQINSILRAGAL